MCHFFISTCGLHFLPVLWYKITAYLIALKKFSMILQLLNCIIIHIKVVPVCVKVIRLLPAASSLTTHRPQFYHSITEGFQAKAEQPFCKTIAKYRSWMNKRVKEVWQFHIEKKISCGENKWHLSLTVLGSYFWSSGRKCYPRHSGRTALDLFLADVRKIVKHFTYIVLSR